MTRVLPRSNPSEGATYSDFCALLETLWNEQLQEPTAIEINPVDEGFLILQWVTPFLIGAAKARVLLKGIKAFTSPVTGTAIPLTPNEQVPLGVMRFLGASGEEPLALLGLYPLAQEEYHPNATDV